MSSEWIGNHNQQGSRQALYVYPLIPTIQISKEKCDTASKQCSRSFLISTSHKAIAHARSNENK